MSVLSAEQRGILGGVVGTATIAIEDLQTALDDVEMSICEGIERSWENRHPLSRFSRLLHRIERNRRQP
jgi:hypothetical protein